LANQAPAIVKILPDQPLPFEEPKPQRVPIPPAQHMLLRDDRSVSRNPVAAELMLTGQPRDAPQHDDCDEQ
jgi:hypothetical protein